jgi:hypothetical protein
LGGRAGKLNPGRLGHRYEESKEGEVKVVEEEELEFDNGEDEEAEDQLLTDHYENELDEMLLNGN